jgi:hypothetical protein
MIASRLIGKKSNPTDRAEGCPRILFHIDLRSQLSHNSLCLHQGSFVLNTFRSLKNAVKPQPMQWACTVPFLVTEYPLPFSPHSGHCQ